MTGKLKNSFAMILASALALSMISTSAFAQNTPAESDAAAMPEADTAVSDTMGSGSGNDSGVFETDEPSGRITTSLDGEWTFTDYDGNETTVTVPHSWEYYDESAETTAGSIKTCTYTRTVDVSGYEEKELFVKFEAVNKVAKVYVDGEQVGYHNGGYTAFSIDITEAAAGKDSIELKVETTNISTDSTPVNSDFTYFSGIYRDVELIAVDKKAYISLEDYGSEGVYLKSDVDLADNTAYIEPTVMLSYDVGPGDTVKLETVVKDADGAEVGSDDVIIFSVYGGKKVTAEENTLDKIVINDPHLWQGTDDPYLYTVETTVSVNDEVTDTNIQKVGLRTYEVKDGSFYLNGELYELHGVGMHQDYNCETNAVSDSQREEDIDIILEMGANALRTCHYPHDQYTYELCDEKGIVVWCEIPFVLLLIDSDEYKQSIIDNAVEMVKQYMDHSSIIVWGIENEVSNQPRYDQYYDQASVEELTAFMTELAATVKNLDSTRLIGEATMDNSSYRDQTAGWTTEDSGINVVGFNLYTGWYNSTNGATAENKINTILSRTRSKLDTYKNVYDASSNGTASYVLTEYGAGANIQQHADMDEAFVWKGSKHEDYGTYGSFHPEEYQSYVHEGMFMAIYGDETNNIEPAEDIWAAFAWCMFDFSCFRNEGDMPRTNTKGLVTADRQTKKDAFYLYKANWNDTDYFTHICSSRYTERSSRYTEVRVYSNCDSVELFVNGESYGKGTLEQDGVFVWEDVKLNCFGDKNHVTAVGTKDGEEYTDTCDSWIYAGGHFNDVDPESYYFDAVEWAYDNGVTTGTSETTFSPENTCTRCEFVTFLWRAAGCPEPERSINPFSDISEESYYYKAVLWAYEKGITTGTSSTTFSPKALCLRNQVVTFLWRYEGEPDVSTIENPFADVSSGSYYYEPVLWAYENKITTGTGQNFNPDANCTRSQVVTFLYRALVVK